MTHDIMDFIEYNDKQTEKQSFQKFFTIILRSGILI